MFPEERSAILSSSKLHFTIISCQFHLFIPQSKHSHTHSNHDRHTHRYVRSRFLLFLILPMPLLTNLQLKATVEKAKTEEVHLLFQYSARASKH